MRFRQGLYILALIPLMLALICSEIPESHALSDDVSNDLIVRSPVPAAMVAKIAIDNSLSKLMIAGSRSLILSNQGALFEPARPSSGEDLLHLLSIQRK